MCVCVGGGGGRPVLTGEMILVSSFYLAVLHSLTHSLTHSPIFTYVKIAEQVSRFVRFYNAKW